MAPNGVRSMIHVEAQPVVAAAVADPQPERRDLRILDVHARAHRRGAAPRMPILREQVYHGLFQHPDQRAHVEFAAAQVEQGVEATTWPGPW